jgi:hypothetical protein
MQLLSNKTQKVINLGLQNFCFSSYQSLVAFEGSHFSLVINLL